MLPEEIPPDGLEVSEDCLIFRPTGQASLELVVNAVTSAIESARKRHWRKLLVVTTGWSDFPSPGLGERYFHVRRWAEAAGSAVKVALVVRAGLEDSGEFGGTVASNVGFSFGVFLTEADAFAWLNNA